MGTSFNDNWNTEAKENKEDKEWPVYVALFTSRNKDNKSIPNFKERRKAFLMHSPSCGAMTAKQYNKFKQFVHEGKPGEMCRFYKSINSRNVKRTCQELVHKLIDAAYGEPTGLKITHMDSMMASIAAQKKCAAEKKWLIDFDSEDDALRSEFVDWICKEENIGVETYRTPYGWAIITERGFDVRPLNNMPDWDKMKDIVEIKKDGMLCIQWLKR